MQRRPAFFYFGILCMYLIVIFTIFNYNICNIVLFKIKSFVSILILYVLYM